MAKLDNLLKLADKLFTIKGHADELNKVITIVGNSRRLTGQLPTSNENLALLRSLAYDWSSTFSKYSRKDINCWLEWSGADLMNPNSSKKSVKKLKETLVRMKSLRSACNGFEQLVYIVLAADNLDPKGLATSVYVPSLVAIDAYVAKETAKKFKSCRMNSEIIIKVLQSTLPAAVENYDGAMNLRAAFQRLN